ncbi:PilZ domain-containing protein [Reinekea blandensis]|uniref:PilZ domain-containing protein n=1 Tax=Reinekea blandensis MED297 TaxID=314283 RepID=A4BEJ1_9GAMM|nr:PilZ domain-containing protein [Reinekea blandensis]EAR09418.1 hypothetical protein MED297_02322 [Reinekea sp. MED297] [Reinekea blandensis MED297]
MAMNDRPYDEKRNFIRMTMNASAVVTINSDKTVEVTCIDLSAGGMSIRASQPIAVGTDIHVNIASPNAQFNAMDADGTVIRCDQASDSEYEMGVELNNID